MMLNIKFQGHPSTSSGEEYFNGFYRMGMAIMLVMWHLPFEQMFVPSAAEALRKICLQLAQSFARECLKLSH